MSNLKLIFKLWRVLNKKRKKQLFFTLFIMIISGFLEIVSISTAVPFLSLLSNNSGKTDDLFTRSLMAIFNISNYDDLLLLITLIFIFFGLISGFLRILNIWINHKIAAVIGNELSTKAFKNVINQNYEIHLQRNSSEIISALTTETQRTISAINLVLRLLTNLILVISIIFGLLIIEPKIIILVGIIFIIFYYLVFYFTKQKLYRNSKNATISNKNHVKTLQEGLGDIRNLIIDNKQSFYFSKFNKWDLKLRNVSASSKFISQFPKYIMETAGIIVIASLAYIGRANGNNSEIDIIPLLGLTAISAQKLLPSFQAIYNSWTNIKDNSQSIITLLKLLEIKVETNVNKIKEKLPFKKQIELRGVVYRYPSTKINSLNEISIAIKKGEKIGITGETGSGKSTLIDLIMALLIPIQGLIEVDSKNINTDAITKRLWQNNISHVPQNIFLSDTSIMENIALGVGKELIDKEKLFYAAKLANIHKFINSLPNGYKTTVGERGVQLSGGQVQRLGIARALYKDSELLILDEATSALDYKTEKNIIDSINKLPKTLTLIMIAHRKSTLKSCDRIFNFKNGRVSIIQPSSL